MGKIFNKGQTKTEVEVLESIRQEQLNINASHKLNIL